MVMAQQVEDNDVTVLSKQLGDIAGVVVDAAGGTCGVMAQHDHLVE